MKIHILGLFPDSLDSYFSQSLLGRARENGLVSFYYHQLRDWAKNKYGSVDDKPYGGGCGMVMLSEVVCAAVRDIKAEYQIDKVIFPTPSGWPLTAKRAKEMSQCQSILFLCGRYEGVDQRAIDLVVDQEISLGDYVISSGELASAVIVDAICRYIPGVVGKLESVQNDSHEEGLLEHPHYTRPEVFEGLSVPKVLLEGHHQKVALWRNEESLKLTQERRPELIKK